MPELPDDDSDFTPDLARAIIAKYQEYIRHHTPPASAIRGAAETARACLAGLVSAGHNCPSPDPDQIEKAFWALDVVLAGSAEVTPKGNK